MLYYKKQKSKTLDLTSEDLEKTKTLNNLVSSELLYKTSFIIIVILCDFHLTMKQKGQMLVFQCCQ